MLLILGRKGADCSLKTLYNLRSKSVFKDIRQVIRQESFFLYLLYNLEIGFWNNCRSGNMCGLLWKWFMAKW